MLYYTAQVCTGHEQKFIDQIQPVLPRESAVQQIIFLQKVLHIQRHGIMQDELTPLFPGYVFLETDRELDAATCTEMRQSQYFFRFLKSNRNITPLCDSDLKLLRHFMSFGERAEPSRAYFNAEQRIVVTEGPLKGLEGNIVKVDKRKSRAKIKVNFEDSPIIMDLAFDLITGL
jgi:Transcription antiterminator